MTSNPVSDGDDNGSSDHSSLDSSSIAGGDYSDSGSGDEPPPPPPDTDSDDPDDPDLAPDKLGIYTGPEANGVLARSHACWHDALRTARSARPGQFPDNAFDLEALLHRIPALPDSIPSSATYLEGHSTWVNSAPSCTLREKTEQSRRVYLRSSSPLRFTISSGHSFQMWDRSANNGIALLVLGWAYILNASLAERQNLAIRATPFNQDFTSDLQSPCSAPLTLDFATSEETMWWKAITDRTTTFSFDSQNTSLAYLPWSVVIESLGGFHIVGRGDDLNSAKLPTAGQAATYLARFCAAYDLGNQCSAALAAALCFSIHRSKGGPARVITLPRPQFPFSNVDPQTTLSSYALPHLEFISYYMMLALGEDVLIAGLESVLWEPDIPCNHAGQWLWPLRKLLGPLVETKDYELLAKLFASTSAAPLWLGTMIGGGYPLILRTIDYCTWFTRKTIDTAAWTGIARSFMALTSPGPYMQNGMISRPDVWRLRRDCGHLYDKAEQNYTLEPLCGWRPFGFMRLEDVELELHDHLTCSHQWIYKRWTWLHSSTTDTGCSLIGAQQQPAIKQPKLIEDSCLRYVEEYQSREDVKAIRRVSRLSTGWVFKWCGNQVEKGFTGHVVPPYHSSREPLGSQESTSSLVDTARVREWVLSHARSCEGSEAESDIEIIY